MIKEKLAKWTKEGMYWPFVHDPVSKKPSVTLMFFYLTFILAFVAVGVSSFYLMLTKEYLTATVMPTILLVLGYVFYRLRRLDSVEIDLDDRELRLNAQDRPKKEKPLNIDEIPEG